MEGLSIVRLDKLSVAPLVGFIIGLVVGNLLGYWAGIQWSAYMCDCSALNATIERLSAELESCRSNLSMLSEEFTGCRYELSVLGENVSVLLYELEVEREEKLSLEREAKDLKEKIRDLERVVEGLKRENSELKSRIENLTAEKSNLEKELELCRSQCKVEESKSYRIEIYYVMYDPPGTEPDNEYIVLYNPNDVDVDISGWYITDGEGVYVFPQGTIIEAHGFLKIYGREYNPTRYTRGLWLNNKSDHVALYNDRGELIDCEGWGSERC